MSSDDNNNFIIAIDGPTASGKGTVAKLLAKRFGIACLSTGAIYRGVCIYFMDNNVGHEDIDEITKRIGKVGIGITCGDNGLTMVSVDGVDVTDRLETITVSQHVAGYAKIPVVRARVKQIQNMIVESKSIVCEGRDITSVVFPNAKYKFYLTASLNVRAKRRHNQEVANGEDMPWRQVRKGIHGRDLTDMHRAISPLVRVKDAVLINSTRLNAKETVDKMARVIEKRREKERKQQKDFVPKDFQQPFEATFIRRAMKFILYVPHRIFYPTRFINKKEVKKHRGKGIILAIQHRSNGDSLATFLLFPQLKFHCPGKEGLFKPKTVKNWFYRCVGGFPIRHGSGNNNDLALIRHCINILKKNEALMIFPEGRRNFDTEFAMEIQPGTAMIAMKSGAPVVPIVTNRKPKMFRLTKFKVGSTIYPNDFATRDEFNTHLRDTMMSMLNGFEKKPRQPAWDKLPVPIARGIVFRDGKLVAIKRNKKGQEYYVFPGGHVDEGETPRDAAVRELKEETNITCTAVRPLYKNMYYSKNNLRGSGMNAFYLCAYKSGEVSKTDAEEYTDEAYRDIRGTYEPVLLDVADLKKIDLRPHQVRDQLVKDIKKYTTHLTRPLIYVK